jgi:molybdate transport system ATP-binding protein
MPAHLGIYLSNSADKKYIIEQILNNELLRDFHDFSGSKGHLFSTITLEKLIDEEFRHDSFIIQSNENKSLSSMSSGQQRFSLLKWQIAQNPDYLILDDVYSNIDHQTQLEIRNRLCNLSENVLMIQIFFRKMDILPFINQVLFFDEAIQSFRSESTDRFLKSESDKNSKQIFLPEGYSKDHPAVNPLIELRNIHVQYDDKHVLENVNWQICQGEFWQLCGPNGSGKSTLISMICGDNPKAYGQDLTLFGFRKGSGESIWDIKKHIGYFTPNMINRFRGTDTIENMIISGLNDSVGLYIKPTDIQRDIARHWIEILGPAFQKSRFNQLSTGQQRMVMVARAMIKHPPLLILDEPTIELDDVNSNLFIQMIKAIASEKQMAIIYVSHREEENLKPERVYELVKTEKAYTGHISL